MCRFCYHGVVFTQETEKFKSEDLIGWCALLSQDLRLRQKDQDFEINTGHTANSSNTENVKEIKFIMLMKFLLVIHINNFQNLELRKYSGQDFWKVICQCGQAS